MSTATGTASQQSQPQQQVSESAVLAALGLSESEAQELFASSDQLIARYGAEMTVERFLELHCEKHVAALQSYCDQRILAMQQEAQQQMEEMKTVLNSAQ